MRVLPKRGDLYPGDEDMAEYLSYLRDGDYQDPAPGTWKSLLSPSFSLCRLRAESQAREIWKQICGQQVGGNRLCWGFIIAVSRSYGFWISALNKAGNYKRGKRAGQYQSLTSINTNSQNNTQSLFPRPSLFRFYSSLTKIFPLFLSSVCACPESYGGGAQQPLWRFGQLFSFLPRNPPRCRSARLLWRQGARPGQTRAESQEGVNCREEDGVTDSYSGEIHPAPSQCLQSLEFICFKSSLSSVHLELLSHHIL